MSHFEPVKKRAHYYGIYDGVFTLPSVQTDPEARPREWKSPDGSKSGTKYEREFEALFGRITDINFHKGDFGTNLNIIMDENEDGIAPIVSISANSRYSDDFLKKAPNINFSEEVKIRPFDFITKDTEKRKVGISITQRDEEGNFTRNVYSFFSKEEKQEDGSSKWVAVNGYPTPEGDDDWELFYKLANRFLIKYTQDVVIPKIKGLEPGFVKSDTPKAANIDRPEVTDEEVINNSPFTPWKGKPKVLGTDVDYPENTLGDSPFE